MFTKKEIISILVITLILGFTISLVKSVEIFLYACLMVFLILIINIISKKITAFYFEAKTESKIWEIERYGFLGVFTKGSIHPSREFKKPFAAGAFFPFVITILSLGYVTWMAPLTFDVKPRDYRAVKRHGYYSFSEMTEMHIGIIAAVGVITSLFFAVIGYLLGFTEFARLSIFFAFFSMLPFSELDGNKIYFGSFVLWSFLAALTLIGLGYAFLLV